MGDRTRLSRGWRHAAIASLICAVLLTTAQAQGVREPAPGVLLVAAERMGDPRFNRAVVLLIEHDQTGTWGVIINKPTEIELGEALPDMHPTEDDSNVYFGGPVGVDRLMFLYRDEGGDGDSGTGLPGVRWSDSHELLERRLRRDPGEVRIYAGFAGWAPGQLAFELAHGGWRMIEGRGDDVFTDEPERLWQRLTDVLGGIAI